MASVVKRDPPRSDVAEPASIPDAFRPFNYVPPAPVIRQIGDRDVYLGNVHAADPATHDHAFDCVVSATSEPQPLTTDHHPLTTDHHPLADGPDNHWSDFAAAVDTTRRRFRGEGSVLVHCKAGISRSTTLLAAAIAVEETRTFSGALELVRAARGWAFPHPALHEWGVYYVAAYG